MGASQLQTYLTNTKGSHHPGCSENRDKQKRFQSTSSTLHLQLIKYIKLFQLLLLLLWCESLCFSALLCFNKFELVQYSALLCPFLFSSTLLCSFSATYNQQLDFSLWPKPAQLCSTTASPNCCGLSPHQSASVLKKRLCL